MFKNFKLTGIHSLIGFDERQVFRDKFIYYLRNVLYARNYQFVDTYRVHKLGCNNYIGFRTQIYKENPDIINIMIKI